MSSPDNLKNHQKHHCKQNKNITGKKRKRATTKTKLAENDDYVPNHNHSSGEPPRKKRKLRLRKRKKEIPVIDNAPSQPLHEILQQDTEPKIKNLRPILPSFLLLSFDNEDDSTLMNMFSQNNNELMLLHKEEENENEFGPMGTYDDDNDDDILMNHFCDDDLNFSRLE